MSKSTVLCCTIIIGIASWDLNGEEQRVRLNDLIYIFRILDQETEAVLNDKTNIIMYRTCITSNERQLIHSILKELENGGKFMIEKHLLNALKNNSSMRLSHGSRWMIWDSGAEEWVVMNHRYGAKKTDRLYAGEDVEKAVKVLTHD